MCLRISLCGDLSVEVDGERRDGLLRGRHGRLLLAYLVLHRAQILPRHELVEALWGDTPPPDPSASLRVHLSRLRDALGAASVEGTATLRLRLPAEAWVDVEDAARRLAEAEVAAAARRWVDCARDAGAAALAMRLPLLPGLDTEWITTARAELDGRGTRALELLAAAALEMEPQDVAAAQRAARAVVQRAPYRELGHRLLIRALLAVGEIAEGLRAFDAVRTLFRDELGIGPSAQLRALHAALLASTDDRPPAVGWRMPSRLRSSGSLVGRRGELSKVVHGAGAGAAVVVTGEAGVGKTRLIGAAAAELRGRGWTILYGRCDRVTAVPYQGVVEALDGALDAVGEAGLARIAALAGAPEPALLAVLLPGWRCTPAAGHVDYLPGVPQAKVWRLHRTAQRFLDALAVDAPVLLCIDDVHDADLATLAMLRHLAENSGGRVAVLVGARRTGAGDPAADLAGQIRDRGGLVHLDGLARDELADLLRTAVHGDSPEAPASDLLDAIHAVTGGNPLHALQLAREAGEVLTDPLSRAGGRPGALPHSVRDVVSRRVSRLPEPVQTALATAAVIGVEFDAALLAAVTGRDRSVMLDELDVAVRAGLVRESPGGPDQFTFVHGLVQRAVYSGQGRSAREARNRRVAQELEARGVAVGASALLAITGTRPAGARTRNGSPRTAGTRPTMPLPGWPSTMPPPRCGGHSTPAPRCSTPSSRSSCSWR